MSSSGCLSGEEFLAMQEQLIALRNRNYELQEKLQKKDLEIAQLSSPKSEAIQFASKLMNRRGKEKELTHKYEGELDALRAKLMTQEEEFRLQQKTLISELNKVVLQNQSMEKELNQIRSCESLYSSPQAGTPCEPKTIITVDSAQANTDSAVTTDRMKCLTSSMTSEAQIEKIDRIRSLELFLAEKDAVISALEDKLLEYKERPSKLEEDVSRHGLMEGANDSAAKQNGLRLSSPVEEIELLKETLAERDSFITKLQNSLSLICKRVIGEGMESSADYGKMSLEERMTLLMESFSLNDERNLEFLAEKKSLLEKMSQYHEELESIKLKLFHLEACRSSEEAVAKDKITSLSNELSALTEKHAQEMHALKVKSNVECEELKNKLAVLEQSYEKQVEDRVLLLETRYQLELSDREKLFDEEKEDWNRKLHAMESSLAAKDEEKVRKNAALPRNRFSFKVKANDLRIDNELAIDRKLHQTATEFYTTQLNKQFSEAVSLKKQAALIKELQRAVREERKRAETMEKHGSSFSDERGWHLVTDPDARSGQTLDGADSRSISSISALESDNAELINRLTSLQRTHADAMDRINVLESENLRLNRELEEKRELIEHWIRKRPLFQSAGVFTSGKQEGSLRRFLATTLTGDDATNDVREMNKKLQRMLEETLSKNIILQRIRPANSFGKN